MNSRVKRWRVRSGPVDGSALTVDASWLRRIDDEIVKRAVRHPAAWRDGLARSLVRDEAVWAREASAIPRDAVVALTLKVQAWLIDQTEGVRDAGARRALRTLWEIVTDRDVAEIEVLVLLDAVVKEEPEDRLHVMRANLAQMFGAPARDLDEAMVMTVIDAWVPRPPGAPSRKRWAPVIDLLHALGLRHVKPVALQRLWRRRNAAAAPDP